MRNSDLPERDMQTDRQTGRHANISSVEIIAQGDKLLKYRLVLCTLYLLQEINYKIVFFVEKVLKRNTNDFVIVQVKS